MNNKSGFPDHSGDKLDENRSGGNGFSLKKVRPFESFKYPAFRIYYGGMAGQWFATAMQMMVGSLLIYRLTGSATLIGIMALARAIPQLVMCLFGGALADRLPKKYLIITCQAVTAVISLAIAVALSTGYLSSTNHASWWVLIFTSVIQGGLTGIMEPARISIISEIVGEKQVMNAISLTMMGQNISRLIGPAVAGFLVDKFQFSAVYYLNTGIYVIAVIFAIFLPRTGKQVTRSTNTLQDVVAGLRYARRETGLLLVVLFGFTIVIFGMPYVQLTPVFTESILKVGASGLGILTSVSGIGALVGSFILASLPNRKRGIMLVMSGVIMGIAVIVFAWSKSWPLSLAIVPFAQLGPTIHQTMVATLIQSYADPSYRGRMQSLATMSVPLSSLGTFLASVLADSPIGIEWAVGGMAILLTIVSFGFLAFARPLTKLE